MLSGIQYSQNGLELAAKAIDIVANNLANVSTNGFKRSVVFAESIKNAVENPESEGIPIAVLDLSQGRIQHTGNELDLAIDGPGFFAVQTKDGLRLTRQGNFTRNDEGFLVNANGDQVLGEGGPILINENTQITEEGNIVSNESIIDRLSIHDFFDRSQIRLAGNGYFMAVDESTVVPLQESHIKSGYLENSNVDPLAEMVNMIEIYRQFEANQKAIRAQDETLQKAVNEVGRVS